MNDGEGKRVSWVELYLDLIFVLAVGELAHLVVGEPEMHSVWVALVAAMILAAALWWLYFDAAAEVDLEVLELSGGSPTMARAIFAVGHMLPSFALLLVASGVGLLLEEDPPRIAIFQLGRLHETLSPHAYLWLLAALAVTCAALAWRTGDREEDEEVATYIGRE